MWLSAALFGTNALCNLRDASRLLRKVSNVACARSAALGCAEGARACQQRFRRQTVSVKYFEMSAESSRLLRTRGECSGIRTPCAASALGISTAVAMASQVFSWLTRSAEEQKACS